jgi:hypothetical protein
MSQKLKITTYVFILCLCGLTLITVSPVFAEDSEAFVECQKIKPNGQSYDLMKEKKNCFRDLARALNDNLLTHSSAAPISDPHAPSPGPNVIMDSASVIQPLNDRILELENQLSDEREAHRVSVELYEQTERELRARADEMVTANGVGQEPLNARIAQLEHQLNTARESGTELRSRLRTNEDNRQALLERCNENNRLHRACIDRDIANAEEFREFRRTCARSDAPREANNEQMTILLNRLNDAERQLRECSP